MTISKSIDFDESGFSSSLTRTDRKMLTGLKTNSSRFFWLLSGAKIGSILRKNGVYESQNMVLVTQLKKFSSSWTATPLAEKVW